MARVSMTRHEAIRGRDGLARAGIAWARSVLGPGWICLAISWGLLGAGAAEAAETSAPGEGLATTAPLAPTNSVIGADYLQARLTALSNRTDLAVAVRTNALAIYGEAEQRLVEARRHVEESQRLRQEITNAPAAIVRLQAELAAPLAAPGQSLATNAPIAELQPQLARLESELNLATKDQEALALEPQRRAARATEIARLVAEGRAIRERILAEMRTSPSAELDAELRQAGRDLLQSRLQYRDAELDRHTEETAYLNATADVVRLQLDLARRRVAALNQERDALVGLLNRRRDQETLQAAARAEQTRLRAEALNEPLLSRLAQTNALLARERTAMAERLRATDAALDAVKTNRQALRESFGGLQERVGAAEKAQLSRNYAIGLLLRRQQEALAGFQDFRARAQRQSSAISEAQIAQFAAVDARRQLEPIEETAQGLMALLPSDTDPVRQAVLTQETRMLLGAQRELLTGLVQDYDTHLGQLFRLQVALGETAGVVDEFADYLAHRVLWIRSNEPLGWAALNRELAGIRNLVESIEWRSLGHALVQGLRQSGGSGATLAFGIVLLLAIQPWLRRFLAELAGVARQGRNTSIAPTFKALAASFLRAAPLPLLLVLGWRAAASGGAPHPAILSALGEGVQMLAAVLGMGFFLREVCRPEGLAVAHLRMPEEDARLLRRSLAWYLAIIPFLAFANSFLEAASTEGVSNRLLFLPTTLFMAALGHYLLRPTGGLGTPAGVEGIQGRGRRWWRRLVHLLAVGLPVLFAIASMAGYNYSARHLWLRFMQSVLLAVGLHFAGAIVFRWVTLVRRRLAMEHALRQRAAEGSAEVEAGTVATVGDDTQSELLASLAQAQRLLRWALGLALAFGLWGIWSGTLTAFQALDRVPLWQVAASGSAAVRSTASTGVAGTLAGAAAETDRNAGDPREEPKAAFVTLWDLIVVLLMIAVAIMAAANLPGFLEMAVFSHFQLDRGTSYALTTSLRYAIIVIGIIVTAKGLGLAWSQVQWLAAAVSLGIGFGLQEVFANFVSGLILLFERPVRIGDVVTVGDISGVVTKIQIRATTIRDWDNRELILPNKELITGRFLNWTLSDSITRITCTIGIAYAADVRRAQEILLSVVRRHPAVLADPAPIVIFESFGESSLNLTLRAHVSRTDQRATTLSEVNAAILDEFRQAGIEIPYPQRIVQIRRDPADPPGQTGAPNSPA